MPDYRVFGGVLRSELQFPELEPESSHPPRWRLSRVAPPHSISNPVLLGREEVEPGVGVTLCSYSGGLRLTFDDTGVFDVSRSGRRIDWAPVANADLESVRKDVLGRVFAVALDQEGVISLHGSAVALGEVAIAFLAPKFHGKSTTAAALVNAGGRMLADDLVPVTPMPDPMVLPSVRVVQLWKDSADRLAGSAATVSVDQKAPKRQIAWEGSEWNATEAVPLAAVYLLAPVQSELAAPVSRQRVTGVEAALALLGQAKVAALLGVERRSVLLQRLADLAERVPVYRLKIPRDFERIGELTSSLLSWHTADRSTEAIVESA